MVCPACGTTFCKCKQPTCPTCAESLRKGDVLVEYKGDLPRYSVHGYNWRQANRRAYVAKVDRSGQV